MITLTREEAQQVLAAFCQSSQPAHGYRRNELHLTPKPHVELYSEAIELLRAKLSEPEPEPVAWISAVTGDMTIQNMSHTVSWAPLYTAPPQRDEASAKAAEWIGLTDEEITELWEAPGDSGSEFARAIEAKIKEKNYDKR